jgi:hypothetical protein
VAASGEQPIGKLGRYELVSQIGHGGMAEVQLAVQRGPGGFEKLVVIKLVHANLAKEKTFVDMLLDEARMAALVKHPNVVDIYDLGEADGRFFIAMEYLEGEPLLGLLRAGREGKRLDCLSTARLIADTAEGLDAAHELQTIGGDPIELVHHDVSLGNIMVLYNGQVKLVDFGVAKASESAGPQMKVHGKFGYMAPEKLKGRGSDRRGDIWSLGVVLWEALTLRRLFRGSNEQDTMRMVIEHPIRKPSEVNKDSAPELDAIVMKALARDPDERYKRAKDLAVDLEEVLRVKGYGGKNDQIAKYMQATFAAHIAARKKLLQEVMAKGKADAGTVVAAFDEVTVSDGQAQKYSGEFAIAFARGNPTTPPAGMPRAKSASRGQSSWPPQTVRQAPSEDKVDEIIRRTSEEMMAEGTPHTTINMPKRATKQMFAEATPVQTDPDIPPMRDPEDYDRQKYPRDSASFERMQTSPVVGDGFMLAPKTPLPVSEAMESDAAVMAMVASLEPDDQILAMVASLEPAHRPATPMPVVEMPDDDDEPDAAETMQARSSDLASPNNHARAPSVGALLRDQAIIVKLDDKLDVETKQQLGHLRQEQYGRNVNSLLDKLEEASGVHDVPPDSAPSPRAPKRVSAQMVAQIQAEALARVTSQRLTVIKKPATATFDASAPVIVVKDPKKLSPFLIIAIIAILGAGAFAVLFFAL